MTADEYVNRVGELVAAGRGPEALDLAVRVEPTLSPPLSAQESNEVGGLLECAAMATEMSDSDSTVGMTPVGATLTHRS